MASSPSSQRQIARATLIVMAAFVLSRLLGYVRQAVIGAYFGVGPELDAYVAAFRIPDLLFNVIAGGALSSAFIPTFANFLARGDRPGAWRMTSAIAGWIGVSMAVAGTLAAIFAPAIVESFLATGRTPADQALTIDLLRIMLISTAIFGLSGLMMAILHGLQRFAVPAVAPILYNLGIIGGALLLPQEMGVYRLAYGVVAGALMHLLVQLPLVFRLGVRYVPTLGLHDEGVRHVVTLMGPRVVGLAVVQINFLVETALASPLGPGAVSALNYAWQAMMLPQAVFAQAAGNAAFPTFAEQAARGQLDALRDAMSSTLRAVLFLAIPATLGLILLRAPFIGLLLERGAFTAEDTSLVAWALLFYALGLAAHSSLEIVTRVFYALHDTRTPVLIGVIAVVLNVIFSVVFIQIFKAAGLQPIGGLGLANALATWVEALALLWLVRSKLQGADGTRLAHCVLRAGAATVLMALALLAWLALLPPGGGTLYLLLLGGGGALLGLAVYWGSAWLLGSAEARALTAPVLRRLNAR